MSNNINARTAHGNKMPVLKNRKNMTPVEIALSTKREDIHRKSSNTTSIAESWQLLIADMINFNPTIKSAKASYIAASRKSGFDLAGLIMPDQISTAIRQGRYVLSANNGLVNPNELYTHSIKAVKNLSLSSFLSPQISSLRAKAARADLDQAISQQIVNLAPHLLLLMQAPKLLHDHEINITRLKRGLDSAIARSSSSVGFVSTASIANAKASYSAGLAAQTALKDRISLALARFKSIVGREPYSALEQLVRLPRVFKTNINQAPAAKASLYKYQAARSGAVSSKFAPMPALTAQYDQGPIRSGLAAEQDRSKILSLGVECNIYDRRAIDQMLEDDRTAKSQLYAYKQAMIELRELQNTFNASDIAKVEEIKAIAASVKAADKYALAEERKFESGYSPRGSISDPETMLSALKQVFEQRMRQLDAERALYRTRIEYMARFNLLAGITSA